MKELVRLLAKKSVRFTPRIRFSMAHELSNIKPHLWEREAFEPGELPVVRFIPAEPASRGFVNFTVYDPVTNKQKI